MTTLIHCMTIYIYTYIYVYMYKYKHLSLWFSLAQNFSFKLCPVLILCSNIHCFHQRISVFSLFPWRICISFAYFLKCFYIFILNYLIRLVPENTGLLEPPFSLIATEISGQNMTTWKFWSRHAWKESQNLEKLM